MENNDIQVAGLKNFPESKWRDAVLFFLNGIWSGDKDVMSRPKIDFGGKVTLAFDKEKNMYYGYGVGTQEYPAYFPEYQTAIAEIGEMRGTNLESGLIRFVKNNQIKTIEIHVMAWDRRVSTIRFFKKYERSEYGIWTDNLPRHWNPKFMNDSGPIWERRF